jgi:hypothetical protein
MRALRGLSGWITAKPKTERIKRRRVSKCIRISGLPLISLRHRRLEDFDEVALKENFWGADFLKRWARQARTCDLYRVKIIQVCYLIGSSVILLLLDDGSSRCSAKTCSQIVRVELIS